MKYLLLLFTFSLLLLSSPSISSAIGPPDTASISNSDFNILSVFRPSQYVTALINFLLGSVGVAAFLYLLWGGIQWLSSGGDKEAVEKARRRIMHALIGLSGAFSAYALIFVIQALFGITVIDVQLLPIGSVPPPLPPPPPPPVVTILPTLPPGPGTLPPPTPPPTLIPYPPGSGSCTCSNSTVTSNSCDLPGAPLCTGPNTCACFIVPTRTPTPSPTLFPTRTPTPFPYPTGFGSCICNSSVVTSSSCVPPATPLCTGPNSCGCFTFPTRTPTP